MSGADEDREVKLARETSELFGHGDAEQALLASYKSGRVPHAWLIGGPPGIGKSTLAYRFARFVLAHPDPTTPHVQNAISLAVDPSHPVARHIAAQALGDLLVLERVINEQTGKLYTVIRVDDVMTRGPKTVRPDQLISETLELLNATKVTALFAVEAGKPVGVIHVHDLLRAGAA